MFGGKNLNTDNYFIDLMNEVSSINIYNDNVVTTLQNNDIEFNLLIGITKDLLKGYYETPAFGVALNNETLNELKKGMHIEFVFDKTFVHNELTFEKLLVNINQDFTGFNIIRYHNNKYDGRCFYINLKNKNMKNLYKYLNENYLKNININ